MGEPFTLTPQDAATLAPIIKAMPEAHQSAFIRHLTRMESGEAPHDSAVLMLMEIGATKAEAHASVDRALATLAH
jgi:hypothetical protein